MNRTPPFARRPRALVALACLATAGGLQGCMSDGSADLDTIGRAVGLGLRLLSDSSTARPTGSPTGCAIEAWLDADRERLIRELGVQERGAHRFDPAEAFVGLLGDAMAYDHQYRMAPRRRSSLTRDSYGGWSSYETVDWRD